MFCCVGIVGGAAVGQALGGPWTVIVPAAGFGIGLVADMRMMRGQQQAGAPQVDKAPEQGATAAPAAQSGACCGAARGVMTLAEIRKTYQEGASEPPVR